METPTDSDSDDLVIDEVARKKMIADAKINPELEPDVNTLCLDGYSDNLCDTIDIFGSVGGSNKEIKRQVHSQLPWIEKYRPKRMEDIILDANILKKLQKIISEKNMPNIIITGVPGVGKTTTIKNMAHGLYGKYLDRAVLELNASDDRGIKMVDESIANFCKNLLIIKDDPDRTYAKHKMIILDEADNITEKAQYLINKKMEEYSGTIRFAFTCNTSSDISEAIQSRCIILRYIRIETAAMVEKLKYICEKEDIEWDPDALEEISVISQGDMRNAINILQMTHNGTGSVTKENVYKICDKPQPMMLYQLLILCKECAISRAFGLVKLLKESGYSESDIVLGMMHVLKLNKYTNKLSEQDKIYMMGKICKGAYNISNGINTDLQLYSCVSDIIDGYL